MRVGGAGGLPGLRLPLIYNTNAYDDVGVLRLLEGIFDIYLPDLRYSEDAAALEYSKVPGYVGHSRAAVAEMYRQVGDELITDERGLVQRGLIIRLLILPNDLGGLRETLEWIRETLSPRVTLSVMSQYYPSGRVTESASRCWRAESTRASTKRWWGGWMPSGLRTAGSSRWKRKPPSTTAPISPIPADRLPTPGTSPARPAQRCRNRPRLSSRGPACPVPPTAM